MTTPDTQSCTACQDLERGREQAAAVRDRSKVTDFHVLIARHRARHPAADEAVNVMREQGPRT
ncbi:hypothetical protein ACFW81_30720 [Streptomyces angustmyceticus]|uniref:hypothetical protein n=1 Tax=Streptomyces angustmyceticus TaxID=285578 RepID=UPI003698F2BF